jgi:hypothetical protein
LFFNSRNSNIISQKIHEDRAICNPQHSLESAPGLLLEKGKNISTVVGVGSPRRERGFEPAAMERIGL